MKIIDNNCRNGNFTSSEIVRLMGMGKRDMTAAELAARPKSGTGSATKLIADPSILDATALEYIAEKNMERRLGRSLKTQSNARPLTWGKAVEGRCFEVLGTEYTLVSQDTLEHPIISFWKGSPDGNKFDEGKTVIDIKCPITLKSFCQLVDPLYEGLSGMDAMNKIRETHADGEKYYWQIVSNAVLTESKYGELIVYAPYKSELPDVREYIDNIDGDPNAYAWINWSPDNELPWISDNGFYKNVNVCRFEIPTQDKILLQVKVEMAGNLLQKP